MVTIVLRKPVKDYATRSGLEKQVKVEIKNSCKICGSTTTAKCQNCNVRICFIGIYIKLSISLNGRTNPPCLSVVLYIVHDGRCFDIGIEYQKARYIDFYIHIK
jgi:hypothetical protein